MSITTRDTGGSRSSSSNKTSSIASAAVFQAMRDKVANKKSNFGGGFGFGGATKGNSLTKMAGKLANALGSRPEKDNTAAGRLQKMQQDSANLQMKQEKFAHKMELLTAGKKNGSTSSSGGATRR